MSPESPRLCLVVTAPKADSGRPRWRRQQHLAVFVLCQVVSWIDNLVASLCANWVAWSARRDCGGVGAQAESIGIAIRQSILKLQIRGPVAMELRKGELGASKLIGESILVNWPKLVCGSAGSELS